MKRRHGLIAVCGTVVLALCQPGVVSAAELSPDANPGPLHYVALGDSYSSGEGAPYVSPEEQAQGPVRLGSQVIQPNGWLGDTASTGGPYGGNGCHRSAHAYGPRVWGELDREESNWGVSFRACSGATTLALWDEFKGEPAQFDAFAPSNGGPADLITVGLGGNDVGFADIVRDCVEESVVNRYGRIVDRFDIDPLNVHGSCQRKWETRVEEQLPLLSSTLRAAYTQLQSSERLKSGGKVIAVGFPRPFPYEPTGTCSLGTLSSVGEDTMRWVNEGVVDQINAVISEEAHNAGISYIDTSDYLSRPDRHDLCIDDGSDRWINRVIPSDLNQSIHPKYQYHEQVAAAVLACWASEVTTECAPNGP